MKAIRFVAVFIFLTALLGTRCKKTNDPIPVTNLDQIAGIWKWESACGGFAGTCSYPTSLHYGEILFATNARYIETHNDTIYLAARYEIIKSNNNSGTLVLHKIESDAILSQSPICILDNKLVITYGGQFFSTYKKTK